MGLFNRDEKIPELPKAPVLPPLPKTGENQKKDLPELPTFPTNSRSMNLNQEIVKSAVSENSSPNTEEINVEIPRGVHVKELKEGENPSSYSPNRMNSMGMPELPPIPTAPRRLEVGVSNNVTPPSTPKKPAINEPIFIRIDKFQSSQKNLEKIKENLEKIEIVMKKIEDVKIKEEAELKGWIGDISQIKSRLAEVDKDIFDQM